MVIISVSDPIIVLWLDNFKNKSKVVNQAVAEYKARHYDGVYFNKLEIEADIQKHKHKIKELEQLIKRHEIEEKEKEDKKDI